MLKKNTVTINEIKSLSKAVIAQGQRIPKVFESKDGCIVKLFHQRKLLSSNRINPYGKRFADNAKQLIARGIHSMEIEFCKRLQGSMTYVVKYKKIPGVDVREKLQENPPALFWQNLAKFIAELHEKGIFFRGIHLGNIVVLKNQEFALIDISRVKFYKKPLSIQNRWRNLNHLVNYRDDEHRFRAFGKTEFLNYYFAHTKLTEKDQQRLISHLV